MKKNKKQNREQKKEKKKPYLKKKRGLSSFSKLHPCIYQTKIQKFFKIIFIIKHIRKTRIFLKKNIDKKKINKSINVFKKKIEKIRIENINT